MVEGSRAPLLSIGLPVYNAEKYLSQTLENLLSQTFRDFELVVSDNASTDSTESICRGFCSRDRRVKYHRNARNLGAAPNFNRAFELAVGKYFKFAAYDDLHEPDYLRKCIDLLEANPGAVLCQSKVVDIDSEGKVIRHFDVDLRTSSPDPVERFRYMVCINHSCFHVLGVVRRAALEKTPVMGGYVGSDRVLLAMLAMMGPFEEVPEPLFLHREHNERSTRAYPDLRRRTEWFDSTKGNVLALPALRLLKEYQAAIRASSLGAYDKARCFLQLFRWLRWNGTDVGEDILFWIRGRTRAFPGK
ncbi:MAG TPA: glycosyltransferase [Fibrobacteria bacterium]|nr:glycosyltransferase [Fibrobacteria bacterium]